MFDDDGDWRVFQPAWRPLPQPSGGHRHAGTIESVAKSTPTCSINATTHLNNMVLVVTGGNPAGPLPWPTGADRHRTLPSAASPRAPRCGCSGGAVLKVAAPLFQIGFGSPAGYPAEVGGRCAARCCSKFGGEAGLTERLIIKINASFGTEALAGGSFISLISGRVPTLTRFAAVKQAVADLKSGGYIGRFQLARRMLYGRHLGAERVRDWALCRFRPISARAWPTPARGIAAIQSRAAAWIETTLTPSIQLFPSSDAKDTQPHQ